MTTATDIQKQLEGAWESAERAQPQAGDTYIRRAERDEVSYEVGVAARPILARDYRILERAKPKRPEWEAVVASYVHSESHRREVYFRVEDGAWESGTHIAHSDELVDPVPLVELPEREAVADALEGADWGLGGRAALACADAVLELLRGERRA